MRQFTSKELRKTWKDFYIERGHVDVGAVSLISDGSTGVLFNVAGMQPLMPYLLGEKHPKGTRLCNVQGCVRTNDIDSVGDKSHVTFFEMMGSWSLGDYFKEDRCKWSYELLTEVFGFDRDHLAATVFAGDGNAPRDEEGAACRIASGFKSENIYYLPAEDNWWGLEYGPCGPDSEMFYIADVPDCGPDCGPGCSCGKYTELGNDVFMQYEKHKDGHLTPLKQKNVDTGWGLERILAFLNGTKDVYRTDLFTEAVAYIERASGAKYDEDEILSRSMRILADHIRTSVMLIGDAARLTPSNVGAGYVLRRLIRRAVRHGRRLGLGRDSLLEVAKIYIDKVYDNSYPLLIKNREFILSELEKEIVRFESTLENGMKEFMKILEARKEAEGNEIDGESAFYLYDTFGFPIELTVEMAEEEGLSVDEAGFNKAMEDARARARENQSFSQKVGADADIFEGLGADVVSEFTGYEDIEFKSVISAIQTEGAICDEIKEGETGAIIAAKTPFYATMGGQIADTGIISTATGSFRVDDVAKLKGGRIAHIGTVINGTVIGGQEALLKVDERRRASICKNHSATHLLQKALKEVLGEHVEQAGSLVTDGRLRFDFSHDKAMTADEITSVEKLVNEKIAENLKVKTDVMSLEDAKKTGAMALFGEKYGDEVRVVNMGGWSVELCGGTHVPETGRIGSFKIVSETGIAAGVRRIEALTGDGTLEYYADIEKTLQEAARAAKTEPGKLAEKVAALMDEIKALQSENQSLKDKLAKASAGNVLENAIDAGNDLKLLPLKLSEVDMNAMRTLGDDMKAKLGKSVIIMASENAGKVNLLVMASDDAVAAGIHAGNIIKEIAPIVGGGGGGRPNMAQAGGKNAAGIDDALSRGVEAAKGQIA